MKKQGSQAKPKKSGDVFWLQKIPKEGEREQKVAPRKKTKKRKRKKNMSQAAGALRATERAERAGRAERAEMQRAPAASRWTSPSRRAVVQGALGLTAAGLTAAAVYGCKKLTEKYRLIVLSGDDSKKGVARELSWTQMMLLGTLLKHPQKASAEFSSESIVRDNNVFRWDRLDGEVRVAEGGIHRPLQGSVVACIDGDTAQCSVLSGEDAQRRIPGVVATSGGTKRAVSAVSAAMAYTWLEVTLKNARSVSNGIGWVSVRALSDEIGNWLDPPAECTPDDTNFSIKCHSGGDEATRTEQTIPIAQIHVKVDRESWFDALFGFSDQNPDRFARNGEDALEKNKSNFQYDPSTGVLRSVSEEWNAGIFTTKRLFDLRKSRRADTRGKTKVRFVTGDVAILHGDPEYAGAVFLASSNLDCLQHEARNLSVTRASGVADYVYQRTQGAACAISCAPGTIVRNYFAHDTEVNTLRAVIERLRGGAGKRQLLDVSHGSAYAENAADLPDLSTKIDALSPHEREATMGLLEVGIQEDTEVTCAKLADGEWYQWYRVVRKDPALRVTQVLAGALQFADGTDVGWRSLASLVFEAAYEATLHVAGANKANQTVVLTALCGESAPPWLAEATAAALGRALAKFQGAGLDVVINEPRQGVYVYKQIWGTLLALGLVSRTPHFGHASAESYKAKLYTE